MCWVVVIRKGSFIVPAPAPAPNNLNFVILVVLGINVHQQHYKILISTFLLIFTFLDLSLLDSQPGRLDFFSTYLMSCIDGG
jgi:hypothetical protein